MKIRTSTAFYFIILVLAAISALGQTGGDRAYPVVNSLPKPDYPPAAKSAGIGGDVIVVVLVDKKGVVKIVDSYGPMTPCSDINDPLAASVRAAAVDAAKGATFFPATYKGKPIDRGFDIKFVFDPFEGRARPDDVGTVQSVPKANWPVAVTIPKAKYPRTAGIKNGDTLKLGTMVEPIRLKILLDENGHVLQAGALSGIQRVHRETAVKAACQSVFRPATRDGKPIKFELIFEHNFYNDFQQKQED